MKTICVVGLGKLGSSMLSCFAHRGWEVIGVDILKSNVDTINNGKSPIFEPLVNELIFKNKARISATTDIYEATLKSDITFIVVPTPSMENGAFNTQYVEEAIRAISEALKKKNTYHLIVITSTIMPGESNRLLKIIEDISKKECGKNFGLCYNPDFIALGSIVRDFLNPDMILIGESDAKAGSLLEETHRTLVNNKPEIHHMSFYNAELAKIALNAYCTLKITFANVIGEICETMPTGNSDLILEAIGSDTRIGKKYFKSGLGYGGPCVKPDTLIQTDKGLIKIIDLKLGDLVLTHNNQYRKVTQLFERPYTGFLVKIISAEMPSKPLITTPDHPIWTLRIEDNSHKVDFIAAHEITIKDVLLMPVLDDKKMKELFPVNDPFESEHLIEYENNWWGYIIQEISEEFYSGTVYNIEIEEDNSYVLEHGTVHNCFPRDNRAFANFSESLNIKQTFSRITDAINNYQKNQRIPELVLETLKAKKINTISILGVTYKENINIIEESSVISLIKYLSNNGFFIKVYDPSDMIAAKKELQTFPNVFFFDTPEECIQKASVCLIGTPWQQFKNLSKKFFLNRLNKNAILFDCWGIYKNTEIEQAIELDYRRIGINSSSNLTRLSFISHYRNLIRNKLSKWLH